MTVHEALGNMYAEELFSRLEIISGASLPPEGVETEVREPLISSVPYPHQNVSGNIYRGANAVFIPMVSSRAGYRIPLWMTPGQANDMGVHILKGEKYSPVSFSDIWIKDLTTGGRSEVSIEEYDRMDPEEKSSRKLMKMCSSRWYKVYNIQQTDFASVHPVVMDRVRAEFSVDERPSFVPVLDAAIASDEWVCPVREVPSYIPSGYDMDTDVINIHSKDSYLSDSAYYSDLLRGMARSTGSELRQDRCLWSTLAVDRVREGLVTEIAAATMGSLLGLPTILPDSMMEMVPSWMNVVSTDSLFVYDAVRVAASASECMQECLSLKQENGLDLGAVIRRHDRELAERMEEKKAGRVERYEAHKKGRSFTPKGESKGRRK